jgi:hypothetical protein
MKGCRGIGAWMNELKVSLKARGYAAAWAHIVTNETTE